MSDYGRELEFGVFITPSNSQPQTVVELAALADRVGLDLVSFQDHPYQARFLDGRQVGRHLIDVHDMLRRELIELREVVAKVRAGALSAGDARSALNEMALRQNDWTLGAFCARYCSAVAQHHGLEDDAIFPHLKQSDAALGPVIDRLGDEHLVIHHAIEDVDRALVHHINNPDDFDQLQAAIDLLTDTLLARLGFYPNQV